MNQRMVILNKLFSDPELTIIYHGEMMIIILRLQKKLIKLKYIYI